MGAFKLDGKFTPPPERQPHLVKSNSAGVVCHFSADHTSIIDMYPPRIFSDQQTYCVVTHAVRIDLGGDMKWTAHNRFHLPESLAGRFMALDYYMMSMILAQHPPDVTTAAVLSKVMMEQAGIPPPVVVLTAYRDKQIVSEYKARKQAPPVMMVADLGTGKPPFADSSRLFFNRREILTTANSMDILKQTGKQ